MVGWVVENYFLQNQGIIENDGGEVFGCSSSTFYQRNKRILLTQIAFYSNQHSRGETEERSETHSRAENFTSYFTVYPVRGPKHGYDGDEVRHDEEHIVQCQLHDQPLVPCQTLNRMHQNILT